MEKDNSTSESYKKSLKNTFGFGVFQAISFVISMIRAKVLAVFLGTAGVGINSLFNSTLNLITCFSLLGLELSATKELSQSFADENKKKLRKTIAMISMFFLICACLGSLLTAFFSAQLSVLNFKNSTYTLDFLWLSVCVFFTILFRLIQVILKATQNVRAIILSGIYSAIAGLLVSSCKVSQRFYCSFLKFTI